MYFLTAEPSKSNKWKSANRASDIPAPLPQIYAFFVYIFYFCMSSPRQWPRRQATLSSCAEHALNSASEAELVWFIRSFSTNLTFVKSFTFQKCFWTVSWQRAATKTGNYWNYAKYNLMTTVAYNSFPTLLGTSEAGPFQCPGVRHAHYWHSEWCQKETAGEGSEQPHR